jgi:hypothetical protein
MITLEYSEEQGAFHNNRGETEENTNGYKTLGKVSENDSFRFVEYIRGFGVDKPKFDLVKEVFDNIFGE